MKTFKLESVLEYRRKQEEKLAKDLAAIEAQLQRQKAQIHSLKVEKENLLKSLRKRQKDAKVVWDVVACFHYITVLERRIEKAEEELKAIQIQHEIKQKQLIETAKERRIIEKLKEKWWQNEQHILIKKEQFLLDEVAINGFIRREG
ncbi:MAG: flagellar export protein FliJ [Candidatus Desulfofervidaceae bacterium]|nr:flagellar export protein FliJ [Candidatus Desulfofervidaceae bacterium]